MTYDPQPAIGDHIRQERIVVRDALAGKLALMSRGEYYLPKLPAQTAEEYNRYRQRGKYFPIAQQTLTTMTGTVMSKPPVIKLPDRQAMMERTAGIRGEPLLAVVEEALTECLSIGQIGLLLHHPGGDVNTQPRVVTYRAETIEDFKTEWRNGVQVLQEVTLQDGTEYQEAAEGERDMRIRYFLADDNTCWWERFYYDGKEKVQRGEAQVDVGKLINYVPFVFASFDGVMPKRVSPPMYALADLCIQIWYSSIEKNNVLFRAGFPQFAISGPVGESEEPLTSGAGNCWVFPQGTDVKMLEFTGAAAAAMQAEIDAGIRQAQQMGASMQGVGGFNGTASTNRDVATMRMRGELSLLNQAVTNVERAFKQLIEWAIEWDNGDPTDFEFALNREFVEEGLSPQMMAQLKAMVDMGYLSPRALYRNLQRQGLTIPEHDFEMDQGLIEHDMPIGGHSPIHHEPMV